jgi:hypothetical protein
MNSYRFGDIVEINGLTTNQLKRWTQIGLITPLGDGGSPDAGWKRFPFASVVIARICDQLRSLNVGEALLHSVVKNLNRLWSGEALIGVAADQDAKTFRDAPIHYLYIGRIQITFPPDDTVQETLMLRFVDSSRLHAILDGEPDITGVSETGIVIPVSRIVTDLERLTGDVLDVVGYVEKKVRERLAETTKADKDDDA